LREKKRRGAWVGPLESEESPSKKKKEENSPRLSSDCDKLGESEDNPVEDEQTAVRRGAEGGGTATYQKSRKEWTRTKFSIGRRREGAKT